MSQLLPLALVESGVGEFHCRIQQDKPLKLNPFVKIVRPTEPFNAIVAGYIARGDPELVDRYFLLRQNPNFQRIRGW